MSSPYPLWGQRLLAARRAKGLTQVQLAHALGVTQQRVSFWEQGKGGATDKNKQKLARILDVPVYELFPLDDDTNGDDTVAA